MTPESSFKVYRGLYGHLMPRAVVFVTRDIGPSDNAFSEAFLLISGEVNVESHRNAVNEEFSRFEAVFPVMNTRLV